MGCLVRRSVFTVFFFSLSIVSSLSSLADEKNAEPGDNTLTGKDKSKALEEVMVWGSTNRESTTAFTNPVSVLRQEDLAAINVATTEDAVKYEPSIVIRRRYIGDSNGTLGLRSANMFQTSRSMVFADGVPLHYFLESRWSGAPRWTMVSASEIAQVEVIYGPFSAEYSGNAMGGVVNIETAIPQDSTFHFDSSYFTQSFDAYGFDGNVDGYKSFVSFGDKVGNLSYYLSYNHLENESQPQSFYFGGDGNASLATASGSIAGADTYGNLVHYYSDTGVENAETDNYKIKVGYEFGEWMALLNLAYEDRSTLRTDATPYIYDQNGNPIYSGTVALSDGSNLVIPGSRLGVSELDRDSVNTGLRLRGPLANNIELEANISRFDVRGDETRASALNPNDPNYTLAGQVTDYGNTGWTTADLKLIFTDLGVSGLDVVAGLRRESYKLGVDIFDSANYVSAEKTSINNRSGGETEIDAAFVQMNWNVNSDWDLAVGARYESWQSQNGYYSLGNGNNLMLVNVPSREETQVSPKFSVGYKGIDDWTLRYSLAKAYRFPIVEELFSQYRAFNSTSIANPGLAPEDGLHHNFMINKDLNDGYLRVNIFYDRIDDQIESFTDIRTSIRTFHSMGEVDTLGVEFIANVYSVLVDQLDLRFNLTYIDAEVVSNPADPSLEGKVPPRMPEWRSNLLAMYHINEQWDVSFNMQYSDDSFGTLDNSDTEHNVYGAQDGYTRFGIKTDFRFRNNINVGVGIDNLTNEIAYVAHPWPGRTFYANVGYQF